MLEFRATLVAALAVLTAACGTSGGSGFVNGVDGGPTDGSAQPPQVFDAPSLVGDASGAAVCTKGSTDVAGCACPAAGTTQACYPDNVDPKTRNVGTCKDGTQTCTKQGEFLTWSACTGATLPSTENCASMVDSNCNGKVGCVDASCATDPACNSGCTDGQTRSCYTGPAGTENVGICKDGAQTCAGGKWPSDCPGQVLPGTENCTDALDHNCNGLPGCLDIFACITNPACNGSCDSAKVDPGCVCPQGTGDTALCPAGTHGVAGGGGLGAEECCPCKASDCGTDTNCCSEAVCAGNSACSGVTCKALDPSCNGMTNADCDDFPEDCDEPCCRCTSCP